MAIPYAFISCELRIVEMIISEFVEHRTSNTFFLFKGILRRNIEHFLKKPIKENSGIPEMN